MRDAPNEDGISLEHFLFINSPVRLKRPEKNLTFTFEQYYRIRWAGEDDKYRIKTESYTYEIEEEETNHELFAFHWEPHSTVTIPHLHLGFGLGQHDLPIDNKAHIPSGRVPVEDVVHFLIRELNVVPIVNNWADTIARSRERFMEHKTW